MVDGGVAEGWPYRLSTGAKYDPLRSFPASLTYFADLRSPSLVSTLPDFNILIIRPFYPFCCGNRPAVHSHHSPMSFPHAVTRLHTESDPDMRSASTKRSICCGHCGCRGDPQHIDPTDIPPLSTATPQQPRHACIAPRNLRYHFTVTVNSLV